MRLEAETTLTKPLLRQYLHWMLVENQRKRLAVVQLFAALLAMLSFLLVWKLPNDASGYVGLALVAVVLLGFFTMPRWSAAMQYRSLKGIVPPAQRFVFLDDAFEADRDPENAAKGRATTRYDALVQAVDDKDAFYLFISKNNAFVIGKADFTVGDAKELVERLAKLPAKRYTKVK
jgi:hypothetical protein